MRSSVHLKLRSIFEWLARHKSVVAATIMLALTEAVYMRPEILSGASSLMGADFEELHRWRLAFAREALFGARHTIPGWYPREVLGTPFAANLQGFPWIPTRLALLPFDPTVAFGVGVAIAAALAAIFTYLYCRRAGLTRIGAAAAGWTFACAGYFSSRVMAGHLPLLEAYPALPLLLWLADRALSPERERRRRFDLTALALSCTFVVVAGHPQIPAYAIASAFLYVVFFRVSTNRDAAGKQLRARVAGAMVLGIGIALAVWWPMLQLIGRSTRILHLAAPDNDVAMPYSRLLALIAPGIHGWADPVELADKNPFTGFDNNSYFWDTASYIGILPLVAIVALLIVYIVRKRMPDRRWTFLACLGTGALIGSLPLAVPLLHLLPGTMLRSPARMLYFSTFCAAAALGAAIDLARRAPWPRNSVVRNSALALILALHFGDLWYFDHWFIQTNPRDENQPEFLAKLNPDLGNARIAEEREDLVFSYGDRYDDAGGFDSIFLARFNQGYLALEGDPPDTNQQIFDASQLPVKALQAMGVRFVITTEERTDLKEIDSTDEANLYGVPNPAPRASFFSDGEVEYAPEAQIAALFAANPAHRLLLASDAVSAPSHVSDPGADGSASPASADYARPSSDEIEVRIHSARPGFAYVLESYDPGWDATVDGAAASVEPANGFAMAIAVPAGEHAVRLRYATPGRTTGEALSLLSLGLLAALVTASGPRVCTEPEPAPERP